ncbi:NAD+ synthetase [Desulfurispirillum indicum S5]|uniref:Glutamine-dependent NAD(+) synthetase n=1 Tax=Desulfurispirillum indicum (strain ATCC BAA-1389 / DSM 22839 / S5) TaxID=653733 RepID=E6W035_DESIS|nr:NAD(+) synthase [Desulfurispirillum indicum]ADU65161.1 NAD+ synthetase [Desulfurispirillum indicum S5]
MLGFYRIATALPGLRVADVAWNRAQIEELAIRAHQQQCAVVVFPELSLTGYTCADLFHQESLLQAVRKALESLCRFSRELDTALVVGAPLPQQGRLYNCALVIQRGHILGAVPKTHLPNKREFYERRWFTPASALPENSTITIGDDSVPFGSRLIFRCDQHYAFAIELCEDLWSVIPPSSSHALAGATVILNPSASNELVAKADYRRELVQNQSARCLAAYAYAGSGIGESSTDLLFGGHHLLCENGLVLEESPRFERGNHLFSADVDCQKLSQLRMSETSFADNPIPTGYRTIPLHPVLPIGELQRYIPPHPFVPGDPQRRDERCEEIFSIQTAALAKRLKHIGSPKAIIGISGGLDSTLALLVTHRTFALLERNPSDIIAITMPGFGTTNRTYENAVTLCKALETDFREIAISQASLEHFKLIGHDPAIHDVTYENVQARERTEILMNIANKHGGIVIGTGDLSEIALGWSTYNGDHMSMYSVNCGVPKTLIRYLVEWVASRSEDAMEELLMDIVNTPITPELLPRDEQKECTQKTEDIIGPYELHDFFLYHTVKYGASTPKVRHLAALAFAGKYDEASIARWHEIFVKRFFTQQFKRSCIPDGPKVGTIALSPRGDWRMPSDASFGGWL